jgi:ADP-ribose pyrophosphatase
MHRERSEHGEVTVDVLDDKTDETPSGRGFIKVRRYTLRTRYQDGSTSEPYPYDVVDRAALDAVVIVLDAPRAARPEDPWVCVRSALRPPVALRATRPLVEPEEPAAMLWELPAGLIEFGDRLDSTHHDSIREAAAREAREETGYAVAATSFTALGPPVFLSPGLCGEKIHFVRATIDRDAERDVTATEVVERPSECVWLELSEALARCARGAIRDAKTELGLRRLREALSARGDR